jgi:hypothetical protein
MLLKDAIASRSANPIAAAARAYQFRGLVLVFHVASMLPQPLIILIGGRADRYPVQKAPTTLVPISREAPRGIHESCAEGNTTTKAGSTETGWQYQRFAASYPIAKDRVPLQPIVLEYRCSDRILPTRWDRMSFFLRKCLPMQKACLASSLPLLFRPHAFCNS